jgi:hypothetical protein
VQWPGQCDPLCRVRSDVIFGTDRATGGIEPVGGMLDIEDARCPSSDRVRWGRGGVKDGALVEEGHEPNRSAVPHKGGEGWPGSYEVCVIGVSN